jgi:ubiquinol-cytochrome c reductase cytochrome b subunit
MGAWTSAATPTILLEGRSPLERQGALVFHNKQCINCHSVGGEGGLRGPALDSVATRLTGDQLVRQVIQGSGNMPAYGKNLSPAEVAAVVAFMSTLHKPTEAPARDSTRPAQAASENTQPNATAQVASREP